MSISAAVAPTGGHVTATDLVPEMLDAATKNASERGVTNITFQQADAEALPFPDNSFDAVTCRFGVMLDEVLADNVADDLAGDGLAQHVVKGKLPVERLDLFPRQADVPPDRRPHRAKQRRSV